MSDVDELAACGYLSTAADGTLTRVNETFLAMTGYGREDLVGRRRFSELLTGGGRIYHETHVSPLLHGEGRAEEIALELVTASGDRLPVLINALLERDDHGEPAAIRMAVFDATARRRYERELLAAKDRAEASEPRATALARTLQQTLIPPTPPAIPGLEVAAVYRPAGRGDEVGGDFFDVFEAALDEWVVVVGDVAGKGVEAAVVTATARRIIRESALRRPRPSDVLHALNDALLATGDARHCTAALLRLRGEDGGRWRAELATGGHPYPLLLRGQEVCAVGRPGSLIGAIEAVGFEDVTHRLGAGDVLVLYTDGVTEARRDKEFYGDARLQDRLVALLGAPARTVVEAVLEDVLTFQRGNPRDDVVVVAIGVP